MKYICGKCKTEKDSDQYYFRPKGRRNSYCRPCQRIYDHQRRNRPDRIVNRRRFLEKSRDQIRRLKIHSCLDCGEEHAYFVMDLDHVAEKTRDMSTMIYCGKDRIAKEGANCEGICVNCHRIRTHDRSMNGPRKVIKNPYMRASQYNERWRPEGPFCGLSKICYGCQKKLPIEWFAPRSGRPGTFVARCRPCAAKYQTLWHQNSSPERRIRRIAAKSAYKQKSKEYVDSYKEKRGCRDCGKKWASYILDFDHIDTDKKFNVSAMVGRFPLKIIIQEIAKCEVVCARCHRYRTQARKTGINVNPNLIKTQ